MELVCIVCPNSCRLEAIEKDGKIEINGAKCPRGKVFGENELKNPMRTVASSVRTTVEGFAVVSVKTDGEIPKSKIFDLMKLLSEVVLTKPVPIGTKIIENVFETGVSVVTTTDMKGGN